MEERLQKILSELGYTSRREAEKLIAGGFVAVNGKTAVIGEKADLERDRITLRGAPVGAPPLKRYLMLNKPRGYVTTLQDEKGRKTVADLVSGCGERVYPVGRLDLNSEGLLLMTNDGDFANRMAHPSFEKEKEYRVTVTGQVTGAAERLAQPLEIDGAPIRPALVRVLSSDGQRAVLSITIHEGRNRQVRKMCERCSLEVKRLVRVSEGGVRLGSLPSGHWRELTAEEICTLMGNPAKMQEHS